MDKNIVRQSQKDILKFIFLCFYRVKLLLLIFLIKPKSISIQFFEKAKSLDVRVRK